MYLVFRGLQCLLNVVVQICRSCKSLRVMHADILAFVEIVNAEFAAAGSTCSSYD